MATTPTFARLSLEQFAELLKRFSFSRQINAVHMHHTWRPSHQDFKGHETIVSMWRFHTQTNGWRDIAQHLTIDPVGMVWLGRNWNLAPASAAGHNGNTAFGPFMFEMIGDFDRGGDPFGGEQKRSAIEVVALLQSHFELPLESLRFHNMMSKKSCPGTGIDFASLLIDVDAARGRLRAGAPAERSPLRAPFPDEQSQVVAQALRSLQRLPQQATEPADAELAHDEHEAPPGAERVAASGGAARESGLDPATLAAMRPHLIDLRGGRLSGDGEIASTPEDVNAIFEQHLPAAVEAASAAHRKLRLLFFAHGGLVSESSGLQTAHKHIDWWRRNDVYPLYFIWETGFFETIAQLLGRAQRGRTTRDVFDFTTDPLIEIAARALQGPRLWGGMKSSAEHAVDAASDADPIGGGAAYAARQLKAFCDTHGAAVELHAVGHSAGAVFHSHFLPTAHALGVPTFKTVQFLAPAVRCDVFKQRLLPAIGAGLAAETLTLFTMAKDFERQDDCARIYRKSLLYLIHHALEDQARTPILGLEESLRADPDLKRLFGLGTASSAAASVVWSPTRADSGRSASQSRTHGGFDDDAPTLNSVVRRILGKADADEIVEYPVARGIAPAPREWSDEVDWPESPGSPDPYTPSPPPAPAPLALAPVALSPGPAGGGRRRALCVGIDAYPNPEHRLSGCVNDARQWERALRGFGFETTLLIDQQATRSELDRQLRELIGSSRAGDVVVFQYAGHGTQVPDLNGDETDGNDEALCPVDFASGALYIDDDIGARFAAIGDGVNMSCFMDCCHSGTNSRFAVGASANRAPPDSRARFVVASADIVAAHRQFRARLPDSQRNAGTGGPERMRDIKFSACLDHEVAWESGGSGEFTVRAMQVLAGGVGGLSNEQFVQRVVAAFGSGARQNPMLDCAEGGGRLGLLQPLTGAVTGLRSGAATGISQPAGAAQALNLLARAMQALTAQ